MDNTKNPGVVDQSTYRRFQAGRGPVLSSAQSASGSFAHNTNQYARYHRSAVGIDSLLPEETPRLSQIQQRDPAMNAYLPPYSNQHAPMYHQHAVGTSMYLPQFASPPRHPNPYSAPYQQAAVMQTYMSQSASLQQHPDQYSAAYRQAAGMEPYLPQSGYLPGHPDRYSTPYQQATGMETYLPQPANPYPVMNQYHSGYPQMAGSDQRDLTASRPPVQIHSTTAANVDYSSAVDPNIQPYQPLPPQPYPVSLNIAADGNAYITSHQGPNQGLLVSNSSVTVPNGNVDPAQGRRQPSVQRSSAGQVQSTNAKNKQKTEKKIRDNSTAKVIFRDYPTRDKAVPNDVSAEDYALLYPNHQIWEGLDIYIKYKWSAEDFWEHVNQALFRSAAQSKKEDDQKKEQPWNIFQKRLDTRIAFLGEAGIRALDAEPEFRRRRAFSTTKYSGGGRPLAQAIQKAAGKTQGTRPEEQSQGVEPRDWCSVVEKQLMARKPGGEERCRWTREEVQAQQQQQAAGTNVQPSEGVTSQALLSGRHVAQRAPLRHDAASPSISTRAAQRSAGHIPPLSPQSLSQNVPQAEGAIFAGNTQQHSEGDQTSEGKTRSSPRKRSISWTGSHTVTTEGTVQNTDSYKRQKTAEVDLALIDPALFETSGRHNKRSFEEVDEDQDESPRVKRSRTRPLKAASFTGEIVKMAHSQDSHKPDGTRNEDSDRPPSVTAPPLLNVERLVGMRQDPVKAGDLVQDEHEAAQTQRERQADMTSRQQRGHGKEQPKVDFEQEAGRSSNRTHAPLSRNASQQLFPNPRPTAYPQEARAASAKATSNFVDVSCKRKRSRDEEDHEDEGEQNATHKRVCEDLSGNAAHNSAPVPAVSEIGRIEEEVDHSIPTERATDVQSVLGPPMLTESSIPAPAVSWKDICWSAPPSVRHQSNGYYVAPDPDEDEKARRIEEQLASGELYSDSMGILITRQGVDPLADDNF